LLTAGTLAGRRCRLPSRRSAERLRADAPGRSQLSLRVDWGDGAVQTFTDLGTKPFHFDHVYADNSPAGAPYLVRVEWFDQHGAGNSRELPVTVRNVPPRLFLGGAEVVRAGELMRHAGHFTDPGADTFTATVDYGDGSGSQPLVILPGQTLAFEHRYATPGKYRVTVRYSTTTAGSPPTPSSSPCC